MKFVKKIDELFIMKGRKRGNLQVIFASFLIGCLCALVFFDLVRVAPNKAFPVEERRKEKVFVLTFGEPLNRESCVSLGTALNNEYQPVVFTGKLFNVKQEGASEMQKMDEMKKKKPRVYEMALESKLIGEEDFVIVADLYDVLYLQKESVLFSKFLEYENSIGKRVVFVAEKHYHPFHPDYNCPPFTREMVFSLFDESFGKDRIMRFPNSGIFMGRKRFLREFISAWNFNSRQAPKGRLCDEDQGLAGLTMLENQEWITMDIKNQFSFQTYSRHYEEVEITKHEAGNISLFDKETNSFPSIFHFNGDAWQGDSLIKYTPVMKKYFDDYPFQKQNEKTFYLDNKLVTFRNVCSSYDLNHF